MNRSSSLAIKAIIFDCDGTLIDSEAAHFYSWQKVVLNRNHFFSLEDFHYCMGNANPAIAQTFATKTGASSPEELLSECRTHYLEYAQKGLQPIRHTVDFALELAKAKDRLGIQLAVASAASKEAILFHLKEIGIQDLFEVIISGEDDLDDYQDHRGVNKPSPYIYWHTAKLLGVEPSDCVVVEDSLPGLTAGIRAGCFTVAVPTSSTKIQDLSAAHLQLKSFENISVDHFFHLVQEAALLHKPGS